MSLPSVLTREEIRLDLFADPRDWRGRYDRMEVLRSRQGEAGPYEALTRATATGARVPADAVGDPATLADPSAPLVGKALALLVGERTSIGVTFTGTDPISFADATAQITARGLGLVRSFVLSTGQLVVETTATGLTASLRIVGGDAAPLLGLPTSEPTSVATGFDAQPVLVDGQLRYAFTDPDGSPAFLYKTRFVDATSGRTSEISAAIAGRRSPTSLTPANLVRGTVDLVGPDGQPLAHRTVLLSSSFRGKQLEQRTIAGDLGGTRTDENGHAEFLLARGISIVVAIAGTELARDVSVPTDPSIESFDLLDPAYGTDDLFTVQRPALASAERRTL